MKEFKTILPDEMALKLENLSEQLGISPEELIRQIVVEHLNKLDRGSTFDPVGFGMWKDRDEMQDSLKWVRELRNREWQR